MSNFFNYKTVQDDNVALSKQYGSALGDLAVCQRQLEQYQPTSARVVQPTQPEGQDNTLEG